MTKTQLWVTILVIMAGTMLTRFIPFIAFRSGRAVPAFVKYLGTVLPAASIGLLVVYCLRNVNVLQGTHGIPEAVATFTVVVAHKIKKNTLISILAGTIVYMFFVQLVFPGN